MDYITPEQQARRLDEIARQHMKKSKIRGDYHWRAANAITGAGDYIPGVDDGEPPAGAEDN